VIHFPVREGIWLFLTLVPFLLAQRILHREIQLLFYSITKSQEIALGLFSLLFLPGILLHELSHYLFARLLGVQTGKFSVFPKRIPGGKLQMGFVETAHTDWIRTGLIGAAPLLTGILAVGLIAVYGLALEPFLQALSAGNFHELIKGIPTLLNAPDFWIWFYLAFVISSTMLPSETDRSAFLPLVWLFIILIGLMFLSGVGSLIIETFSSQIRQTIEKVALIFTTCLLIHLILLIPLGLLRLILNKIQHKKTTR